ncbi:DNA-formamidopyrimidine glycosylase [Saccharibacillus sp. CPCC 101409]|uniref:DNA-formamidopyrimidine glycosylase n=1 Tax=Saccharibacillus sp. CPCC 101409 TaxID=3058041 RepID=UPI0026726624|nr:DNA-formamidopyrimidine glycosylase [Saccharibacillus sp. CPCC 101409]MDO3408872.1 DNA-formamidopyrimidine glycosylase [Saccharibacillus sp. CPCC 101409]
MPELPEVETVKRTLNKLVAGKTIERVTVSLPRIVRRPDDPALFAALLEGHTISSIERSGKFLRFNLDGWVIVSHLRMEGRYGVYDSDDPVEKHTHVIFHFTDGTELRYRDVRQFGTMDLLPSGEEFAGAPLHKLGLEPLAESFTPEALGGKLAGKKTRLKTVLLNQEVVAGIGNIYVDETLFRAGLHPERAAGGLTEDELRRLHRCIVDILTEAVAAGGSSVKSYVNGQGESGSFQDQHRIYGRKGQPCHNCGMPIERIVVGGRGTHYCPQCQKPGEGGTQA